MNSKLRLFSTIVFLLIFSNYTIVCAQTQIDCTDNNGAGNGVAAKNYQLKPEPGTVEYNALVYFHGPDLVGKDGQCAKLGYDLTLVFCEFLGHKARIQWQISPPPFIPSNPLTQVLGNHVIIEAVAHNNTDALVADLEALGLQNAVSFGRIVNGRLPIDALIDLADLTSLKFTRPAYKPIIKK